jgi:NAD(P)-dependent dehydrogenase (short-subunit alcohol dehydrogenase family)
VYEPVHATTDDAWRRTIEVTLGSVFLVSKHVVPHMLQAGGGVILNMASQASLVGYPKHAAYIAAKGGVLSLTRAMAIDYAKQSIRENCVCPTTIATRATQPLLADPAFRERVLAEIPLGRVGQPDDVAHAALYLCSDEARFITGVALPVDGGKTAW